MKFIIPEPNKIQNIIIRCEWCRDSGFIQAKHKENQCVYAFRCAGCKKSDYKGLSVRIPKWNPSRLVKFDILD